MTVPDSYTCTTAAAKLEMHRRTVQELCRTGQLPGAYRTAGGHWRIPETAITAYIAQRQENQ